MRVFVYWNLHKGLWSVRALEGAERGRVILRAPTLTLHNAIGRVGEAGRLRVIREKRKNVHAGIVGILAPPPPALPAPLRGITYNPYKNTGFVYRDDGNAFNGASIAVLGSDRSVGVA